MSPNDYTVIIRKLAEKFITSRSGDEPGSRDALLANLKNNPSAAQFHGFVVSMFASYYTPPLCASIIAASPSQNIDRASWADLQPREALFAMAFEMFKKDVWNEILFVLEQKAEDISDLDSGEQLTMFGAA